MLHSFAGGTQTKEQKLYEAAKANGGVKRGLQRSQAADWPRLAEAPGSLRHAPPAERSLRRARLFRKSTTAAAAAGASALHAWSRFRLTRHIASHLARRTTCARWRNSFR